jgi:hypothetical protein
MYIYSRGLIYPLEDSYLLQKISLIIEPASFAGWFSVLPLSMMVVCRELGELAIYSEEEKGGETY